MVFVLFFSAWQCRTYCSVNKRARRRFVAACEVCLLSCDCFTYKVDIKIRIEVIENTYYTNKQFKQKF